LETENVTSGTAYDDVAYDSEANADTHPIAMATLAAYAGAEGVASAKTARVLEIGCGDGTNLIRMAAYLPNAQFVGFDLAKTAIESGKKVAPANVDLFAADIMDVKLEDSFDYVIAHGMVSWVPERVRSRLFELMREVLKETGVGFVSANALPGWEPRRALRELALAATRGVEDPAKRVRGALEAIEKLTKQSWLESSFGEGLKKEAAKYLAHVKQATPPDAKFERYVFHDLLAPINDPFTRERLGEATGLNVLSETPLGQPLDSPFVQLLVSKQRPTKRGSLEDFYLWADFTKVKPGEYRTTTGALVRPVGEDGLAKAVEHAPGFVRVSELSKDPQFLEQLEAGWREGVFTLVIEPPDLPKELCVSETAVMTNALHRSFRVKKTELTDDRLRRHLFIS
jgi:SAM-dependent methyltransferase